ncbi:MAG: deoxyribonuclease V [Sulfuricella sp.]|nr:deoxyribonuclease V [Sulfuricella sp.]
MRIVQRHAWDINPSEAIAIQKLLSGEVAREDLLGPVRHVAGVDVGFEQGGAVTRAAVAVLGFPSLDLVEHAVFRAPTRFPYVPGLLSFREIPAVLQALAQLTVIPDLLLCDGQGIAHPRRIGIASHLGLLCDIPAIGVAKTRLVGEHGPVPELRGEWVPLLDKGEGIGAVLRTRIGVKPLYISIGHRVGLETALGYVMACLTRYRLPETTRWAHRLASG